ncbi:uncharacterized protein LOC110107947 isoform X1 [Dendrobium catenatum]|uniref:C2H2-type domain-containing protein n=1 Tax=Dendrobium catenatum TaxID=906689 RepID=A0A2I0W7Z5_9ASPA|nr:uncharacterized protein LOC110107947 isoform X1 [Dendrobium catenatum]XP_028553890.1 uncharacterized protein LOC110107947 isoform X1 [Dendrobium catenatum]PKU71788.1 hypothetical protein MA16_Dca008317 [Dendrobium catenatum]
MNPISSGVQHGTLPPLAICPTQPKSALFRRRIRPSLPILSPSLCFTSSNFNPRPIAVCSTRVPSPSADIEMVRGRDGSWSAREQNVVVLWDLDNKPPRGQPYDAAVALRHVAELFGRVVEISAYANRHAFLHLPQWVLNNRRERRHLDAMERKGLVVPDEPYVCGVCGRKCRTNPELKRHFLQLHERERQKKLSRMRSLKGKKRQNYKKRFISGNHKYTEAAHELLSPKKGYGLASELRRAGVFVKTVEDKPQAADSAVKRQMQHSMSRGIDCLFLVSDDSDFSEMIKKAREADLRTVVIGDGRRALGRLADFWVPWMRVEKGEVGEEVLLSGRNSGFQEGDEDEYEEEGSFYSSAIFYDDDDQDGEDDDVDDFDDRDHLVDDVVLENFEFGAVKVSAFSEEEMWDGKNVRRGTERGISRVFGATVAGTSLSWTIEDEDDYYI